MSLKTKASVEDRSIPLNDSLAPLSSEAFSTFEDLDLSSGTQPFRAGLSLGAGAEYNFSGSTSLFFQVNWNYFVTNVLTKQDNEKYLRTYDDGVFEPLGLFQFLDGFLLRLGYYFKQEFITVKML